MTRPYRISQEEQERRRNRLNSERIWEKSTGPKTLKGKELSSKNASKFLKEVKIESLIPHDEVTKEVLLKNNYMREFISKLDRLICCLKSP